MRTITETFEPVELRAKKSGKCICGKRRTRATTFSQTISPFNKKDGRLKTRDEIGEELIIEKEKWLKESITCKVPTYWEMSEGERDKFDKKGEVTVKMECGYPFKKINKNI